MLHYSYPQIVVEEVPGEIAFAISLSGCKLACKGCHSTETWNPTFGSPITPSILFTMLQEQKHISAVLFYGGEWSPLELEALFIVCQSAHLKVCLYTGLELEEVPTNLLPYITTIKVGRYIEELGGISKTQTNQRILQLR